MSTVIVGRQGCGKTYFQSVFARRFSCEQVVDDWDGRTRLPNKALALTTREPDSRPRGMRVLTFDEACRLSGFKPLPL